MDQREIIKWLALSRLFYQKPKQGFEKLKRVGFDISEEQYENAKKDLEELSKEGVFLIPWGNKTYPKSLTKIYDPPLLLYGKGKWEPWKKRKWAAVVGARKATRWGLEETQKVVSALLEADFGIVSGLAYGIDAAAHEAAVASGGVTWGVLGSGLDRLYPKYHERLASKMSQKGGILSEFPLGVGALPYHFPQRNRVISGLSEVVIVVQASLKSGSLITVEFALEQGKEVFVVTPPNKDVSFEGNWKLLEEGATPFECFFGEEAKNPSIPKKVEISPIESDLVPFLKKPCSADFLVAKTKKGIEQILAELILLETQGLVLRKPGGLWQSL